MRLMVFAHAASIGEEFRAGLLSPAPTVSLLMQEYLSQQQAKEGEAVEQLRTLLAKHR